MVRSFIRLVSCAALVSAIALASVATATAQQQPQPTQLHFTTAITQVFGSRYPLTGHLDVEVFPGGNLRGYYHTSYYKLFVPVVGGRDGDYIWFDIGPSSLDLGLNAGPNGKLHVVGTMNTDGSFRGQVYPETMAVLSGPSTQNQFAYPNTGTGTADQYIFAGTPTTDYDATPRP